MGFQQSRILELYDLDGTLNEIDVPGALEGKGSPEVVEYLNAAARFVCNELPSLKGQEADVLEGIKEGMRTIFPDRSKLKNWASFPNTQKVNTPVCPAVDHYLLTPHAIRAFLSSRLLSLEASSPTAKEIQTFLGRDWQYPLYKFCSAATLEYAAIDEDARTTLDRRLTADALTVVLTNSDTAKARLMLTKAGFGDHLEIGGAKQGKIGVIGGARKFEVDPTWEGPENSRFGKSVDLSAFFESGAVLDLRRKHFHDTAAGLMEASGARKLWMASDIPELDLWPVANWTDFEPEVVMRRNPTSSKQSIMAMVRSVPFRVSDRLSVLTDDLPR